MHNHQTFRDFNLLFPLSFSYCQSFSYFLTVTIFFFSMHLTSLMIIGLDFSPLFLGFPMQGVLSISLPLIAKSKCSFNAFISSSSVFFCFFSGKSRSSNSALNIAFVSPQLLRGLLLFVLIWKHFPSSCL